MADTVLDPAPAIGNAAEDDSLFRDIVRELEQIVFRTDAAGRWTYLNPAWQEVTGFPVAESLGKPLIDYVHPNDRQRNQELFQPLIEGQKDCRHEIRYRKRGGGFCWVEVHARPVLDESGRPVGTCGTIADVTARRTALNELHTAREKLHFLMAFNPAIVYSGRLRGGYPITYVSENFSSLLGYPPDCFARDPFFWWGLVHPEDYPEVERRMAELVRQGSTVIELRAAHRDRGYRWLRCDLRVAPGPAGEPPTVVGSAIDITAAKETEKNLAQREAILRALCSAAQTFLQSESWEQEVDSSLVHLSRALGVKGVRLFRCRPGEDGECYAELRHSWSAADPAPGTDEESLQQIPLVALGLGRWLYLLRSRQVSSGLIQDLPGSEQAFFARFQLASLAVAPVFAGETLWGCLSIGSSQPVVWSEVQLDALRAAAEILGAAIHHQQSHADLQIARERLQFVMDSSPAVIFSADPNRNFATTGISENVENLSGISAQQLLAEPESWWQTIHPQDRAGMGEFHASLSQGQTGVRQVRYRHRDGSYHWMRIELKPILDAGGRTGEVIGCLVDTTETMQALDSLRRRESILQAVSFVAERFLYGEEWEAALPAALEHLGNAASADCVRLTQTIRGEGGATLVKLLYEWNGNGLPRAGVPALFPGGVNGDPVPAWDRWEEILNGGGVITMAEFTPVQRAFLDAENIHSIAIVPIFVGSSRWGQIGFQRRSDEGWPPAIVDGLRVAAGIVGAAIRQKEARDNLRASQEELEERVHRRTLELAAASGALGESERLYRTLVETSPDGILVSDLDHRITMVNRRCLELFRHSMPSEQIGKVISDYYRPQDADLVASKRRELMTAGFLQSVEITLARSDGTFFHAGISASLVRATDARPGYIIRIVRDITARKQLEAQFRQAQKMEAIGRLAGGVAHDFNNLLTVIKGYGELLMKRLAADAPNQRKVAQIVKASDRAASLIEQLLAFSRKRMVEPKIVDANAAIAETEKMLRRLIGEDIEFRTHLDRAMGPVRVDPGQLDQLIMNLSVNARDAIESSGVLTISTAAVKVAAGAAPPVAGMARGDYAMIEVHDTGIGMTEEVRAHIFEPFFTTKDVGKGTGLGLSTVYGIVQQSGGFIAVETAPGKGAAFRIYLPTVDLSAAPERLPVGLSLPCGTGTVLVTEDEDSVRAMIVETLEENGYRVLEARNGRQAIAVAREHEGPIDLLLTDVVMPQMSGPELWHRLAPRLPKMRLLYVTGHAGIELDKTAPFLKKPFSPEALARKVSEALG